MTMKMASGASAFRIQEPDVKRRCLRRGEGVPLGDCFSGFWASAVVTVASASAVVTVASASAVVTVASASAVVTVAWASVAAVAAVAVAVAVVTVAWVSAASAVAVAAWECTSCIPAGSQACHPPPP
jgi:hypothetical protein